MTIQELANELNKLIEAGCGEAKATVGVPTLYISDDGYLCKDKDADVTEELYFWSDHFLREDGNKNEVRIIDGNYIEKEDCWDEAEDDEDSEEPTVETDAEDPDAWVPSHEIDLYDTENEEN